MSNIFRIVCLILIITIFGCSNAAAVPPPTVDQIVKQVRPAVVQVSFKNSICSGFHIGDGLIITASHCFGEKPTVHMEDITVISYHNIIYPAELVSVDISSDLSVLLVNYFNNSVLEVWNYEKDGDLKLGMPIISFGFPGYYFTEFTFELGYIKDLTVIKGREIIMAKEMAYNGGSGGPVISLTNGKVIGITDAMIERIYNLPQKRHQHYSLSLIVPYFKIYDVVNNITLKVEEVERPTLLPGREGHLSQ